MGRRRVMVRLHERLALGELDDDVERFNFLQEAKRVVARIDEVHPSNEDDAYYIYLIWCAPTKGKELLGLIDKNLDKLDDGWELHVDDRALEHGFLTVHTWLVE